MQDNSSGAVGATACVPARWGGAGDALDGFPVAALLDAWPMVDDGAGAAQRRARWLMRHILTIWATTIEHDLERFPPANIEVLRAMRRQMVESRNALLRLRSLLDEPIDVAPRRAGPDGGLGIRAGASSRTGAAARDAASAWS